MPSPSEQWNDTISIRYPIIPQLTRTMDIRMNLCVNQTCAEHVNDTISLMHTNMYVAGRPPPSAWCSALGMKNLCSLGTLLSFRQLFHHVPPPCGTRQDGW